jgi:hypothetical protein
MRNVSCGTQRGSSGWNLTLALCCLAFLTFSGCESGGVIDPDVDEQDFALEWAGVWCDRQAECDKADFQDSWTSMDECVGERSDDAEFSAEWGDLLCGDYDESAASVCLSAMGSMQCDDWANDEWRNECAAVYGC